MNQPIDMLDEYRRKAIHVLFSSAVLFIACLSRKDATYVLIATLLAVSIYEALRHHSSAFNYLLRYVKLNNILRQHESKHITGASYVVIATALCYWIFSPATFILSLLVLGWADSLAAIAGRLLGHSNKHGKSIAGSLAFFLTAMSIVAILAWLWKMPLMYSGSIASLMAMLAERYSARFGIDDNLSIPLTFAFTFTICSSALGTSMASLYSQLVF